MKNIVTDRTAVLRLRRLPGILVVAVLVLVAAIPALARRGATAAPADDVRKAEYIFLESAIYNDNEHLTDYYMLLRRAAALNPGDVYLRGALAEVELKMPMDSARLERTYSALQKRFRQRPTEPVFADVYTSVAFATGRYDDALEAWALLDSLMPSRTDPAMNMARIYMSRAEESNRPDTADLRRALAIFDRLQTTQPANVRLSGLKSQVLAYMGDSAAVIAELERLMQAAAPTAEVLLYATGLYNIMNRPDQAEACLDSATALAPDNGAVRRVRARLYAQRSDTANYVREVELALQSQNLNYGEKFNLYLDYLRAFAPDSAAQPQITRLFGVFMEANPGEPTLHSLFGEYLNSVGRHAEAAEQYSYSAELDPSESDTWNALIQSDIKADNKTAAIEAAKKALRHDNTNLYAALVGASELMMRDSRSLEALAIMDSLRIMPSHAPAALSEFYSLKANLLASLEQPDSAMANYDRAISLNAENYLALNNAAYYMSEHGGDLSRAEIYASIACAAEPENVNYLDTYAWIKFIKGDYAMAKELMDRLLPLLAEQVDSDPQLPVAGIYEHAGDVYFMNGLGEQAKEYWNKALARDPENTTLRQKVENPTPALILGVEPAQSTQSRTDGNINQ